MTGPHADHCVSPRNAARPPPPFATTHIHAPPKSAHTDAVATFSLLPQHSTLHLVDQSTTSTFPPGCDGSQQRGNMTQANIDPQPGPSGPPQDPSKPSYKQLSDEAARAEIVFRVHSEMSASPLHWTGRAETSGFCSPNPHLALLTPGAYAACLEPIPLASIPLDPSQAQPPAPAPATPPPVLIPLDDEMNGLPSTQDSVPKSTQGQGQGHVEVIGVPWISFERDPSIRQSLVDHCTRRTRPSHNWDWSGPDMAADDYSSWISCTGSLRWAVWEAAHRLVHAGEEQVDIAIIGVIAEADDPASISPHGGPGKRPPFQRIRAGASGEVTLAPLLPLRDHQRYGRGTGDRARMTNSEKEAVANAIYMAHSSEEVLFYGRIFTSSVRANLTFTRDVSLEESLLRSLRPS